MSSLFIREENKFIFEENGFGIIDTDVNYYKKKPDLFNYFFTSFVKILVSTNDNVKKLNLSVNDKIILFKNTIYQFIYLIEVSSNNLGISHLCVDFNTCHQHGSVHFVYNYNNDDTMLDYGKEGWNNKYKFIISQFHLISFENNELKSRIIDIFTDYGLLKVRPRLDDYDMNTTKKICS
jgi:hypothetical protein